jgi:hypothetical protein
MKRGTRIVIALAALLLAFPPAASAHERKGIGKLHLTLGWGDEPAYSGSRNFVTVAVADESGAPVTDPEGTLAVEVSYGEQRLALPLLPEGGRPGEFRASLVPTRAGIYTFHITGKIKGQTIDVSSTCSDKTFDCVTDVSEVQFPAKDPSAGELAERVSRALPRAERAVADAAGARNIALAAAGVALLALAAAVGFGVRRGRKDA